MACDPTEIEEFLTAATQVLVVDDDSSMRRAITDMLEMSGFVVTGAEDGISGLELYEQDVNRFDLVVFDLFMPNMGGREMVTQMRNLNADLRSVLISGYGDGRDIEALRAEGTKEVVAKPFTMDTLLTAARRALASEPAE